MKFLVTGCFGFIGFNFINYIKDKYGNDVFIYGIDSVESSCSEKNKEISKELEGFEQCWLTGTAAEVTPVGQIGEYTFEVGALTKEISDSYDKLVRS